MTYDDDGTLPHERARERVYGDVQRTTSRNSRLALASSLLAVGGFLLILAISAYQVTEPRHSSRVIERGVASITDIDRYLAEHLPELRDQAAEQPHGAFALPDYPVRVILSGSELLELNDRQVREVVLRRASAVVHDQGINAFQEGEAQDFPLISAENVAQSFVGALTGSFHNNVTIGTAVLAVLVALAGGMAAAADRRPGVVRTIGGALLAGSLGGLALSASLVFLLSRSGAGDPFTSEIAGIAQSMAEVPRRNFLIVSVFAGFLFLGGIALTYLERRYFEEPEEADAWAGGEAWYDEDGAEDWDGRRDGWDDWDDDAYAEDDGYDDGAGEWEGEESEAGYPRD